MKTNKHHPDRDIICAFARMKCTGIKWTRKETEVLMKAFYKYGKDFEKISAVLKNRTQTQVRLKVFTMLKQIASNPQHENAKYAKIL